MRRCAHFWYWFAERTVCFQRIDEPHFSVDRYFPDPYSALLDLFNRTDDVGFEFLFQVDRPYVCLYECEEGFTALLVYAGFGYCQRSSFSVSSFLGTEGEYFSGRDVKDILNLPDVEVMYFGRRFSRFAA